MAESIEEKIIWAIRDNLDLSDAEEVTASTSFVGDLNFDSLDMVELIMDMENMFEMNIPDEEAEKIQTVGEAANYIKERLANK